MDSPGASSSAAQVAPCQVEHPPAARSSRLVDQHDERLATGEVDAVYIALPNHLHREYTLRAATAGVHVLCEKPLAISEADCTAMVRATDKGGRPAQRVRDSTPQTSGRPRA